MANSLEQLKQKLYAWEKRRYTTTHIECYSSNQYLIRMNEFIVNLSLRFPRIHFLVEHDVLTLYGEVQLEKDNPPEMILHRLIPTKINGECELFSAKSDIKEEYLIAPIISLYDQSSDRVIYEAKVYDGSTCFDTLRELCRLDYERNLLREYNTTKELMKKKCNESDCGCGTTCMACES